MDKARKILGITFFAGSALEAIDHIRGGGLLAVPAAPALVSINRVSAYREALLEADVVIPDSSLMVMVWNFIQRDSLLRLSGLKYFRALRKQQEIRTGKTTLWILPSPDTARTHLAWLRERGVEIDPSHVYIAPNYHKGLEDQELLALIRHLRPRHVIVTLGGGIQEQLGLYLKQNIDQLPAIHCIGAALAFESGDQVHIPVWADKFYLGWLFRCLSHPGLYIPRYWEGRKLVNLLIRFRSELPPLQPDTTYTGSLNKGVEAVAQLP